MTNFINPEAIAKGFSDRNIQPLQEQQLMFQALLLANRPLRDANHPNGYMPVLFNTGMRTGKTTLCEIIIATHPVPCIFRIIHQ